MSTEEALIGFILGAAGFLCTLAVAAVVLYLIGRTK